MTNSEVYVKYENLYTSLKHVISESEKRIVDNVPDQLFIENVNFFVKSYLINICTYLESYLQDIAFNHAKEIGARVRNSNIPYNYLLWNLSKDFKDKELKYVNADFKINKKTIADEISANPYKTIKLFRFLGVNLVSCDSFSNLKDLVNSVVVKRNNIIHHNDNAIDISFSDLLDYIDAFLEYMSAVKNVLNDS
tara:strand:+ start:1026 stop:1607 length:582 start_codon:yes stop_codon:yes gene_type:complete